MTKDELKLAFQKAFQMGQDYWYYADHEFESYNKKSDAIRAKFNEMVKETIEEALANEALEKMAENARELGLDYEPAQEPVAFVQGCNRGQWEIFPAKAYQIFENEQPLYTTPPQRTWVGLTDEDLEAEFGFIDELLRDTCYRTEAKLRSKNESKN